MAHLALDPYVRPVWSGAVGAWSCGPRPADDDPAVRGCPRTCGCARLGPEGSPDLRVPRVDSRRAGAQFELRLIAVALVVCWTVAALLILLAYRPGGPLDVVVGLTAIIPVAIALAGAVWPPVRRGERAFAAIVWLGVARAAVPHPVHRRRRRASCWRSGRRPSCRRRRRPTRGCWRSWRRACSRVGVARRLQGGTALRRKRLSGRIAFAVWLTSCRAILFAAVAVANELALRDAPSRVVPVRPDRAAGEPPACDGPLVVGAAARLRAAPARHGRSSPGRLGRAGRDARRQGLPLARVRRVEPAARAVRVGADRRPVRGPSAGRRVAAAGAGLVTWRRRRPGTRGGADTRLPRDRRGPRDRGHRGRPGATLPDRDRRHDLPRRPSRRSRWLVGDADLHRWRGQLDYWVFLDGRLGQVAGSANGEAGGIVPDALSGTIDVRLTATERGRDSVIYPPVQ